MKHICWVTILLFSISGCNNGKSASKGILQNVAPEAIASALIDTIVKPMPAGGYLALPLSDPKQYDDVNGLIIENLQFTNPAGDLLRLTNCTNVVIRNCYFSASYGEAIAINKGSNITIRNCLFANNRTGVYAEEATGNIKVINNQFVNPKGPYPRGQYVQFNACTGSGNSIEGNKGECFIGESFPEDLVNLFSSQGTTESPITVRNNFFRGGGPSKSGGGIMAGDYQGGNILVENNRLLEPGQYGIAVAGGNNIAVKNNAVVGTQRRWTNIGFYVWSQSEGDCTNITFSGNRSNYISAEGKRNDWWDAGNCKPCNCSPTTDISLQELAMPGHLIDFITPDELLTVRKAGGK
jgi:polygalacturonase